MCAEEPKKTRQLTQTFDRNMPKLSHFEQSPLFSKPYFSILKHTNADEVDADAGSFKTVLFFFSWLTFSRTWSGHIIFAWVRVHAKKEKNDVDEDIQMSI